MSVLPFDHAAMAAPEHLARVHLAAALRLAVLHDLDEGIDNHFTMMVPGRPGNYLILPFGYHWSEATASRLCIFDESGAVLDGDGEVEMTARCIHAPIHRVAGAKVVLHTHQTWATTLCMLDDNRLIAASQTSALLSDQVAYDDHYAGLADTIEEGERLAELVKHCPIVFMKNHGVLATGDTVAQAYRRLYRIERVCRNQILALSTGRPIAKIAPELVDLAVKQVHASGANRQAYAERERLFFEAMMRVLDRELPGYRD